MCAARRLERAQRPARPGRRARGLAARRSLRVAALLAFVLPGLLARTSRAESFIDSLVVVQSAEAWSLELPFAGEWWHEAAENPPRVVVDLIHARSRLPEAPGVHTLTFDEGPVTELSVSQFDQDPARPIVRVTLLLRESLAYHAGRHTSGSRITLARPAGADWGAPRRHAIRRPAAQPPAASREPAHGAAGEAAGHEGSAAPLARAIEPPVSGVSGEDLEALLADSTFFESRPSHSPDAAESAAARTLGDAQESFVAGDTTAAIDALMRCEQFYPETSAAGEGRLLRRLLLRVAGRVVEADLGPPPPQAGPWPLLRGEVFARLFEGAFASEDPTPAAEVVAAWREANPALTDWTEAALDLAERYGDCSRADEAVRWGRLALAARPDLRSRPKVLLLIGGALLESDDPGAASAWLADAQRSGDPQVATRAQGLRADLLYRQGRFAEAASLYEALSGAEVARVERDWALYQLANCLRALGELPRAAETLAVVAADDGNVWAASARVRLLDLKEVSGVALD